MTETILECKNISVKRGEQTIIRRFSLTVYSGDHVAITGPSGSGKSTLLQAIVGKISLADGTITRDFFNRFQKENHIPDPLFSYHHLTAFMDVKHDFRNRQNLQSFFYQQRYNASFADNAPTVNEYLEEIADSNLPKGFWDIAKVTELLQLEHLTGKHLIQLSNGESRRLRIAAKLLKNPKLMLLNHPLTGIDVATRKRFDKIFHAIANSEITLIFACAPNEIPSVVNKVAVLSKTSEIEIVNRENFIFQDKAPQVKIPENIDRLTASYNNIPLFDTIIGMRNVSVGYGNKPVLENIDWTVKQGEHWILSGQNGSGKSTLLSMVNGDHPQAYRNNITLFDRKRGTGETIWDIKRQIGFMSSELYQFFPGGLSFLQVVTSGFSDIIGVFRNVNAEQEETAKRWINLLGLSSFQDKPLHRAPVTMQRLCLLARAMVKNPVLLILDEPCQGFDDEQQAYFKGILDKLSAHKLLTWVYVTHFQEPLPDSVTHQLALSADGKVIFNGKVV